MAIVAVECSKDNKESNIRYVSIGTNQEETDEELKQLAIQYLSEQGVNGVATIVIRISNTEYYTKVLTNQLSDYFNNK